MSRSPFTGTTLPAECVEQNGRVIRQSGDVVEILFTADSSCSQCEVKGACMAFEKADKVARVKSTEHFSPGDEVIISMQSNLGMRAVLLGFILPFILVMVVLLTAYYITHREGLSALTGIGSLLPYYLILSLFNKRLEDRFRLSIRKKDEKE